MSTCADTWRVLQKACWSRWVIAGLTSNYDKFVPCSSDCCARQLRVCNDGTKLTAEDIGQSTGNPHICFINGIFTNAPANASLGTSCFDNSCDIYESKTMEYIPYPGYRIIDDYTKEETPQPLDKQGQYSKSTDDILCIYQLTQSDNILKLAVSKSSIKELTLSISSIEGTVLQTQEISLNGGFQEKTIDCSKYSSGIYVYSLYTDGRIIGTGKFTVVK